MTLGSKIADLRKKHKITQKELAKQLNVSDKVISRWETGASLPDVEMIKKLSQVFDVTIAELYDALDDVEENVDEKENYERIWQYYDYERIWRYKRSTIIASSLTVIATLVWLIYVLLLAIDALPSVYPYDSRLIIDGMMIGSIIVLTCVSIIWQVISSLSLRCFSNTKYYRVLYNDALKHNIRAYLITFAVCFAVSLTVAIAVSV